MFSDDQKRQLAAKLNPEHIKPRTQAGRTLHYIEGWHAIAEANRIFGFDGWTRETIDLRMVCEAQRKIGRPPNERDGWGVTYVAKCRVTVGGVTREGSGSGHGIDADRGLAHESALKEAETDAMKRALMTFGNPFGLALYDKERAGVGVDEPETPQGGGMTAAERRAFFAELAEKMRNCPSVPALDDFLEEYKQSIAKMEERWRPHWDEAVRTHRAAISQRRNAA